MGSIVILIAATAELRPVLISISPDPGMIRPRNYCVMNPFRNRSAERAADQFLRQLRRHDLSVLNVAESPRERYTVNEAKWPVEEWRIGRRKDAGRRVELMYWVRRGNGYSRDGYEEEVYLTVDRSRDPARVVSFSAIY